MVFITRRANVHKVDIASNFHIHEMRTSARNDKMLMNSTDE